MLLDAFLYWIFRFLPLEILFKIITLKARCDLDRVQSAIKP